MKIIITESEKREIYSKYNISNDVILESKLIPTTKNEIRDFQNWVLNTIKDKKVLGVYGADGKWGPKTQLAWSMYGGKYPTVSSKGYGSSKGYSSPSNINSKKGYPYDKLSNNPSSKFIAWVIKKSNGGTLGNDTESYAEAAFNAIKTPQQYSEVAKYLGVDPYNYISGFMDTKQRFHLNSVYSYFITLYGINPNDRPKVFKPKNVKDFQLWVINTKKDRKILGRYGADGDWGSSSLNAWFKYGNEYLKTKKDDNLVIDNKSIEWLTKVPSQVKKQVEYLQSVNYNKPFTILDDKNSTVYAVNQDYTLHNSYPVVTGRDRGDTQKTVSFNSWFKDNGSEALKGGWETFIDSLLGNKKFNDDKNSFQRAADFVKHKYLDSEVFKVHNTPSGVYKRANGLGTWSSELLLPLMFSKTYGSRFITWETISGVEIPIGFHGTQDTLRINPDQNEWSRNAKSQNRKMSFGCVNFRDSDIKDINNFISSGQFSFWLSDTSNEIVKLTKSVDDRKILGLSKQTFNYEKDY